MIENISQMVRRYTLDKFKDIIPFYNNVEYKKSDPPAYIFKLLQLQIEKNCVLYSNFVID